MKTLILGASGLVGRQLLNQLINDERVEHITCLIRSQIDVQSDKLRQIKVDYDDLKKWEHEFKVDTLFCCLGTTIKKAGSQRAFRKVDFDYIVKSASLFSKHSYGHFLLISSIGAEKKSSVFYSQVKGETEEAIKALGLAQLTIIRPSLLLGEREESRPMESFGKAFSKPLNYLLQGSLKKYRGVEASEVASLMHSHALGDELESFIEVERVGKT